jgi:hypothetical protein
MRSTHLVAKRMIPGRCVADSHKGQAANVRRMTCSLDPDLSKYDFGFEGGAA